MRAFEVPVKHQSFRRLTQRQTALGFTGTVVGVIGSVRFLVWMTLFCVPWLFVTAVQLLDGSELEAISAFTGLLLLLSVQASYTAPLILKLEQYQSDLERVRSVEDGRRRQTVEATFRFLALEIAEIRQTVGTAASKSFVHNEVTELSDKLTKH